MNRGQIVTSYHSVAVAAGWCVLVATLAAAVGLCVSVHRAEEARDNRQQVAPVPVERPEGVPVSRIVRYGLPDMCGDRERY
jgi:hypothetical protein